MRLYFIFFFLFSLLFSINHIKAQKYATAESCANFRTGTFTYISEEKAGVTVKRTAKKQTETVGTGKSKTKFTFDIVWTSPCNYTLILSEVSDFKDRDKIGTKLNVQIDQVDGDTYTYHAYDDRGKRFEGKVKKK